MKAAGFFFIILSCILHACSNPKELRYLQGGFDTTAMSKVRIPEPVIQKGDLLSIMVFSDNPAASAQFNLPMAITSQVSVTSAGSPSLGSGNPPSAEPTGYLVDKDGNIQFPQLGILKVGGMTRMELIALLDSRLKDKYLTNPYYTIRFLNYKITVFGEVKNPGVYSIPSEKINLLEAISMAGDLTFFGKRENVLVIREENGVREFGRVDLTKPDIFNSPYYQLKQNDIVMIDMRRQKISANDQVLYRNATFVLSIASTIAIIVALFQ